MPSDLVDKDDGTESVQEGFSDSEMGAGDDAPDQAKRPRRCTGGVVTAAILLLVAAAAVASTQAPASPFKPAAAALMQRFPALVSAVGGALSSAPPLAPRPPPQCNITYTPVAGPRLSAIAAPPNSGMLYGLGYGVQVIAEPWMEVVPAQRQDALWVCGSKQQPCSGKWRLLQGPPGAQAIATDPLGFLYALDTAGRLMQATPGHPDVTSPSSRGWDNSGSSFAAVEGGVPGLVISRFHWAVTAGGTLHSYPRPGTKTYDEKLKSGSFRSISGEPGTSLDSGDRLWAVDAAGKVWKSCVAMHLRQDVNDVWHEVPAPAAMRAVVATASGVRGVAADSGHWKCAAPCNGTWVAVPGAGGKLAQGGGRLWHLSDSGQLEVSPAC